MAGTKKEGDFNELISPFLKSKLTELSQKYGENSEEYNAISKQYIKDQSEKYQNSNQTTRHYQSEVIMYYKNKPLAGVERLYKKDCTFRTHNSLCSSLQVVFKRSISR